ncbi:MAG TPA: phosphomannomutase/phosphoglucomutase [Gammaproteobacteria bacterium]|nr:phosphomannomutase/phosphoglucomutase [Gammaproteobacteria bacterium]
MDALEVRDYNITNNPPSNLFRAYDIRGVVDPENINEDFFYTLGLALSKIPDSSTFLIARDGRLSSPALAKALIGGLLQNQCNVIDIGLVPSPVLYFANKHLKTPNGLMITGSHNPANENGLKLILNNTTLRDSSIQNIRTSMQSIKAPTSLPTGNIETIDIETDYIKAIKQSIQTPLNVKIVIDSGNGATGNIAPKLFKHLGAEVIELYSKIDGSFPNHHPDPSVAKNLKDLQQAVIEHQADLGVAFDGDGDRIGAVTNQGRIIPADLIMALFSQSILADKPGSTIIHDLKCSFQLTEAIKTAGGKPILWKTGHSHIKAKMIEEHAILAGEMSGHIFFNDRWYGFDDGIYAACRLCELLIKSDQTLDELYEPFSHSCISEELKIPVNDKNKFKIMEGIIQQSTPPSKAKTNLLDGIRVDFEDGWGMIRASNTSNNLTLRFEGKTPQAQNKIQAHFFQWIKAYNPNLLNRLSKS